MRKQETTSGTIGNAPGTKTRIPAPNGRRALTDTFSMIGATLPFRRNAEIFGEGEPSEYVYRVQSGAVRTSKLLSDGRRQIGAFHMPGDIFGLEAGDLHQFTAEAISDVTVLFVKRSIIMSLAARDGAVASELWSVTADALRRAHEHMLALGRKSAQERIATFLLGIAERTEKDDMVELPMSRLDIADYLGLSIETVSRTLSLLESEAAIELPSFRRIRLRNKDALSRLNA